MGYNKRIRQLGRQGLLLVLLAGLLGGCAKKEPLLELSSQTLGKDTTWQGTVLIKGDIYVPPGVTLTVLPGTTVKFARIDEKSDQNQFGVDSPYYPEAELIIRGRLIAKGDKDKIIVFTSAEVDARPKDWGAINFLGGDGNVLEYAKILFAYNGVHGHGAQARISHCEFAKNGVAISFKMEEETPGVDWFGKPSEMEITHNLIHQNKGGVTFRNSKGHVAYNVIDDNKFFGVFPKDKSEVLVEYNDITGNTKGIYLYQAQLVRFVNNNITDNKDYNVAVAEAQDYPVEARNNWFGSTDEKKIGETIFDKKNDAEMGEGRQ